MESVSAAQKPFAMDLVVSRDSQWIGAIFNLHQPVIHIWDVLSGTYIKGVNAEWDSGGARIALSSFAVVTGRYDAGLFAYDVTSGAELWAKPAFKGLQRIEFCATGSVLCESESGTVELLDIHNGRTLASTSEIRTVYPDPDGHFVFGGRYNVGPVFLDPATLAVVSRIERPELFKVVQVAIGGNAVLFSVLGKGVFLVSNLDLTKREQCQLVHIGNWNPRRMAFRDDLGKFITVGGIDIEQFQLIDPADGTVCPYRRFSEVEALLLRARYYIDNNGCVTAMDTGDVLHQSLFSNLPSDYTPPVPGPVDPRVDKVMREVLGDDYRK